MAICRPGLAAGPPKPQLRSTTAPRPAHLRRTAIAAAALAAHHGLHTTRRRRHHRTLRRPTRPRRARHRPPPNRQPPDPSRRPLTRAVTHWGRTGQLAALATISRTPAAASTPTSHRRIVTVDLADLNRPSPRYSEPTRWPSTSPANSTEAPSSSAANPSPTWPTVTGSGKPAPPVKEVAVIATAAATPAACTPPAAEVDSHQPVPIAD